MYALLLFAPAATLYWRRAWVFLAVTLIVSAVAALNISSGLLSERARGLIQKGQPLWDRILVILLIVSYVGQVVLIPLDVFRFHLMAKPGAFISFFGLVLYVIGWWMLTCAREINQLEVSVVSVQEQRQGIRSGTIQCPKVRHPICGGFRAFPIGTQLWHASYPAAYLAETQSAMLAARAVCEERF